MDSQSQPSTDKVEPMMIKIVCDDELKEVIQKSSTSEPFEVQISFNSQTFARRACFHTFPTCPFNIHVDGDCKHQVICGTTTPV